MKLYPRTSGIQSRPGRRPGYLGKLLGNARVVRYLAQHQQEILFEFQKLVEVEAAAA